MQIPNLCGTSECNFVDVWMGCNGSTCSWPIACQDIYDTCWKTSLKQNKTLISKNYQNIIANQKTHSKWQYTLLLFFGVVTSCRPVDRHQCFEETYCLHLQSWKSVSIMWVSWSTGPLPEDSYLLLLTWHCIPQGQATLLTNIALAISKWEWCIDIISSWH